MVEDDIDIQITSYDSKYHIDAVIESPVSSRITLSYGSPYKQLRQQSWDLLMRLATFSDRPWLVFGDFNDVCFSLEVKGGRVKGEWQVRRFREVLRNNNLFDLGYKENPFTFTNRRLGSNEYKSNFTDYTRVQRVQMT